MPIKRSSMLPGFLILLLGLSISHTVFAQQTNVTKWSYTAKKLSGNHYELHLAVTLDEGWHIYSQTTPDGGPVATTIRFTPNPLLTLDGKTRETGKLEQHQEPLFGVEVRQYSDKVDFVQNIMVKGNAKTAISGSISFMTCNDSQCLPPSKQAFSVVLK